jgi:hypothetical protein
MLSTRQKFSLGGDCMEMCDLSEIKVKGQVLVLVLYGQVVISAIILRTITKCDVLSAYLNIRIAGSSHHLHLKIIELFLIGTSFSHWKLDKSHGSIFFRFYYILFFTGATIGALLSSWLCALSMVRETTKFVVLFSAADKSYGKLRIRSDHPLQGLCSKYSLSLLFTSSGRRNEVLIFILALLRWISFFFHVTEALKEFKVERHSLRTVVDKESRIFSAFTHI